MRWPFHIFKRARHNPYSRECILCGVVQDEFVDHCGMDGSPFLAYRNPRWETVGAYPSKNEECGIKKK